MREYYAQLGLYYIPRLLQLLDRNPYNNTYGCFDRAYWHFRTMDFPCGMSQEFMLPLALVYQHEFPNNSYYQCLRLREFVEAAMKFMVKSSHRDGTCDDYFPFERAMGAMVFSLYAATESYQLLKCDVPEIAELFTKRVQHLARTNESGKLSNHQALAALAAYNVYEITNDPLAKRVCEQRLETVLSWQHPSEGWFQEYEGADPGYQTATIDFLAKLHAKRTDDLLLEPLRKAVEFASYFMHPDGSYGGEYGSRNTYHFFPHGFELCAQFSPVARSMADRFLKSIPQGKRYYNDDDRLVCHYVYNFLQAYQDYAERTEDTDISTRELEFKVFSDAKIVIANTPTVYAISNLSKGGVTKVFDSHGAIASDTGLLAETADGKTLTSHLIQEENQIEVDEEQQIVRIRGFFCYRKHRLANPWKLIVFRLMTLTVGRWNADLVRKLLQRILITGKPVTKIPFQREIRFFPDRVVVEDRFPTNVSWRRVSCGSDATSIYVAASNCFQESVLLPWQHACLADLPQEDGWYLWQREYSPSTPKQNIDT